MRKFDFLAAALFAASFMTVFVSCEKTGEGGDDTDGPVVLEGGDVSGRYSDDLTLKKGEYTLTGSLQMVAPATLTIEPGTVIKADNSGEIIYILIEQGAKIMAEGTEEEPIIMTAIETEAGAWGGLHICGRAHTNAGTGSSEIGNASYGGNVENDNSGVLKYVVIEYSGYALDTEHEANGISLYGVGSGTSISYVQVKDGSDDGIEFFGGSANIDHCIVENCTDDSFDWTEGWNGKAEYIVAYQSVADCDCLMECDNNGDNADASPVSHPVIRYATFIGKDKKDGERGLRFRAGTEVELSYALVAGKTKSVTLETVQTVSSFDNAESSITDTVISGVLTNEEGEGYDNTDFESVEGNISNYDFSSTFQDRYVGTVGQSGAVSAEDNWTEGWTR